MIDKLTEALNLCRHINNDVKRGFSASSRPDNSVLLTYKGFDSDAELSLEFSHTFKVWMVDSCPYSVRGKILSVAFQKEQLGFITLALAQYNVKLNKRLDK